MWSHLDEVSGKVLYRTLSNVRSQGTVRWFLWTLQTAAGILFPNGFVQDLKKHTQFWFALFVLVSK